MSITNLFLFAYYSRIFSSIPYSIYPLYIYCPLCCLFCILLYRFLSDPLYHPTSFYNLFTMLLCHIHHLMPSFSLVIIAKICLYFLSLYLSFLILSVWLFLVILSSERNQLFNDSRVFSIKAEYSAFFVTGIFFT